MKTTRREQIIDVSSKIAILRDEIESRKTDLKKLEAQFDALIHPDASEAKAEISEIPGASIYERVSAVLATNNTADFTAEQLAEATGALFTSVRSTLSRLCKDGRAERVKRGTFRSKNVEVDKTEMAS